MKSGKGKHQCIRLSRVQKIIINLLLIALSAVVLYWALYVNVWYQRSSDAALEKTLTGQLGITKPYDIVADYKYNKGESSYERVVYVRSNIHDEELYVIAAVSMDSSGKKYSISEPYFDKLSEPNEFGWFYVGEPDDNNWSYFMGDGDFIELGTSNYGKLVNDAATDSWYIELDCLNDYGNSMNGKHLSSFTPDIVFTVNKKVGSVEWIEISERCKALGMTLTDEQAREFTKKLIKSHDDFIASNV